MHKEKKLIELKNLVEAAELSLQRARKILIELVGSEEEKILLEQAKKSISKVAPTKSEEGLVIEGIFDGQNMVGADGKKYSVPANYASKSKLVEGDGLKLTILEDGTFVYKQINPLERRRLIGELIIDEESGEYRVLANNKAYKVLNASITYFKGEPGDRVTLLVPKDRESSWAAVENIFKPGDEGYIEDIEKENSRLLEAEQSGQQNQLPDKQPMPAEQTEKGLGEAMSEQNEGEEKEEEQEGKQAVEGDNEGNEDNEFLSVEEEQGEGGEADLSPTDKDSLRLAPEPADIIGKDNLEDKAKEQEKQPQDIFEALQQTDTADVKQVEINNQEVDSHTETNNQLKNGVHDQFSSLNPNEIDKESNDLNSVKDNQGLEDF